MASVKRSRLETRLGNTEVPGGLDKSGFSIGVRIRLLAGEGGKNAETVPVDGFPRSWGGGELQRGDVHQVLTFLRWQVRRHMCPLG